MAHYNTPNEVLAAIQEGITRGQFKFCVHLKYAADGPYSVVRAYTPVCEENSFAESRGGYARGNSCPEDCRLFLDRQIVQKMNAIALDKEEREERRHRRWGKVSQFLSAPFQWFAKLSGIAQGLIIVLVIVYFSPRIAEAIITIIKALK
jgi:hypothetical protein